MFSVLIAILSILAIVLIALPGLVALVRPKAAAVAAPFYLVLLGGVLVYYLGLSFGDPVPAEVRSDTGVSGLCEQALRQAEQAGLIRDRSDPVRIIVRRDFWNELPQQAKDGIVLCLEGARPADKAQTPVEIVEN